MLYLVLALIIVFIFFLPGFLLRYNQIDWGANWINVIDGLYRLLCLKYHSLNKVVIDLPATGPAIVVANHISGLDPFLLIACSRRPLRFLIAREEYERFGLRWLFRAAGCIPVDRETRPERALREALIKLREGEVIAVFPHGRIYWPESALRKIKGGAVRLAQNTSCLIYPIYISGIRRAGHTVSPIFVPNKAHVQLFPPLDCANISYDESVKRLAQILNNQLLS